MRNCSEVSIRIVAGKNVISGTIEHPAQLEVEQEKPKFGNRVVYFSLDMEMLPVPFDMHVSGSILPESITLINCRRTTGNRFAGFLVNGGEEVTYQ